MILSHRHRFIFLKTTKTGGTSVEIALSRFCGPEDIITPIAPEDEALRSSLDYPGAQNHEYPVLGYSLRDWLNVLATRKRKRFVNHIPAWRVRRLVGEEVWGRYYKFCFERNPWDRVISWYHWLYRDKPRPPLSDFVASPELERLREGGSGVYTIDGKVAVDRVCRFERLEADLLALGADALRLPGPPVLPVTKATFRTDRRHYHDLLGPSERDRIAAVFADEIAWFGYDF